MAESKKKKYRSLKFTHRPEKKPSNTKEFVLTLSVPDGEVVKIESLEKSGGRHVISKDEFAELAGGDKEEAAAYADVYGKGFRDAEQDELDFDDEFGEADDDQEEIEHLILHEVTRNQFLRRGIRRLLLRRLLKREVIRQRVQSAGKSAHQAAHKSQHGNGHEGGREGG